MHAAAAAASAGCAPAAIMPSRIAACASAKPRDSRKSRAPGSWSAGRKGASARSAEAAPAAGGTAGTGGGLKPLRTGRMRGQGVPSMHEVGKHHSTIPCLGPHPAVLAARPTAHPCEPPGCPAARTAAWSAAVRRWPPQDAPGSPRRARRRRRAERLHQQTRGRSGGTVNRTMRVCSVTHRLNVSGTAGLEHCGPGEPWQYPGRAMPCPAALRSPTHPPACVLLRCSISAGTNVGGSVQPASSHRPCATSALASEGSQRASHMTTSTASSAGTAGVDRCHRGGATPQPGSRSRLKC